MRVTEHVHKNEESRVYHQDLLSPFGTGARDGGEATLGDMLQSWR